MNKMISLYYNRLGCLQKSLLDAMITMSYSCNFVVYPIIDRPCIYGFKTSGTTIRPSAC